MKKLGFLFVLLVCSMLTFAGQCPTSTGCTNNSLSFTFDSLPNSGVIDEVEVKVGVTFYSLTVDSIVGNTIYTETQGIPCSTHYSMIKVRNNNATLSVCQDTLPVPVTLVDFSLTQFDETVILTWVTATEINNSHFVIEKSTDGETWVAVGLIAGVGNSNSLQHYTYVDRSANVSYYRLKQVDFDGQFEYSPIIVARKVVQPEPLRISVIQMDGSETTLDDRNAVIVTQYTNGSVVKRRVITR